MVTGFDLIPMPRERPQWGILWISNNGNDWMGANIKTQKNHYGALISTKLPKSLDQKLTTKNPYCIFDLKRFQKAKQVQLYFIRRTTCMQPRNADTTINLRLF